MVQALLNGIINFFFFLIRIIGSILFLPISALIGTLFPSASSYMSTLYTFMDTYVWSMIKFIIQSFIQLSHMPVGIFYLLVDISLLRWAIIPALRSILLIYNVYRTVKGNKSTTD